MAWMAARNTNTKQVAAHAEVAYTTLASFVQGGTQSLKGDTEAKITAAYGASAAEIFLGETGDIQTAPIISAVAAGRLTDPSVELEGSFDTVEIGGLGLPPGSYFATRVDGTSMDRISPHRSLILVNRHETELLPGRRYIFSQRGRTTYKKWETNPPRLEPESTDPNNQTIFPKSEEDWLVVGRVRLTLLDDL